MSVDDDHGLVSPLERRRPSVRLGLGGIHGVVLALLIFAALAPLLWILKNSVSTANEITTTPMRLWPRDGIQWSNLTQAFAQAQMGSQLRNTAVMAAGSLVVSLTVCICAAYVLSILRPRWGPVLDGAIMVTLFVPGVISLVPLYLTIVRMPLINVSLLNTYFAVWLPSGANAFSILVVKRFFDALPRELFEAARVDGAGPLRILFAIVLPLSTPILGVIALLSVVGSWKDFLWPLLVLSPEQQPISVGLSNLAKIAPINIQVASLLLALIVPLALFLTFQRRFLHSVGLAGGIKG